MALRSASTATFVTRSAILHGAAFLAMTAVPAMKMLPQGTKPTEIEFISSKPPKGEQLNTMKVKPLKRNIPGIAQHRPFAAPKPITSRENFIRIKPVRPKRSKAVLGKSVAKMQPRKVTPQKTTPPKAAAKMAGVKVKNLNGDVPVKVKSDKNEKIMTELARLKNELRRSHLNRVAEQEKQEKTRKLQEKKAKLAMAKVLAEERQRLAEEQRLERQRLTQEQEANEKAQAAALAKALADQKIALAAERQAIANKLAKKQAEHDAALAKAQQTINGQGQALNQLKNQNAQLGNRNRQMTQSIRENRAFGLPDGTRDVTLLRQVPGNLKPQYTQEGQLKHHEGEALLFYYVTPQGRVTNVQLIKSSGLRSLDVNAIRAIKKFKFYPGQQGYTKHPVNFALSGEPQALPSSRLRRR